MVLIIWMDHILFSWSSAVRHVGRFRALAIVNCDGRDVRVHVFVCTPGSDAHGAVWLLSQVVPVFPPSQLSALGE